MPGRPISGWSLRRPDRERLLGVIAPHYPDIVADHVTLASGATTAPPLAEVRIIGVVDDGAGVQAMVVEVDGSTRRPDGGTFHITWSLDRVRGRQAVESNEVIAQRGWTPLQQPLEVSVFPEVWRG